jgi:hypothetical protein
MHSDSLKPPSTGLIRASGGLLIGRRGFTSEAIKNSKIQQFLPPDLTQVFPVNYFTSSGGIFRLHSPPKALDAPFRCPKGTSKPQGSLSFYGFFKNRFGGPLSCTFTLTHWL